MTWTASDLAALDTAREVKVETTWPDGTTHRTTIWVIVDEGDAFVRSVRGDRAMWWQSAVDRPDEVALIVDGRRLPVRAVPATDDLSVARCSSGLERKYAGDPATESMVREHVLGTTLRLDPR